MHLWLGSYKSAWRQFTSTRKPEEALIQVQRLRCVAKVYKADSRDDGGHKIVSQITLCGVVRRSLVQTYGDYTKYASPDDEMIARMVHLPLEQNKLQNEKSAHWVKEWTAEYKINNRSIHDILDQICKDTDLYPYVKQQSPRELEDGHFMLSTLGG